MQALGWARQQQALSWELRAATSLARLWHQLGQDAEAVELLSSVYNRFSEGFETADLGTARGLIDKFLPTEALAKRLGWWLVELLEAAMGKQRLCWRDVIQSTEVILHKADAIREPVPEADSLKFLKLNSRPTEARSRFAVSRQPLHGRQS
jgi:hypothetical protein